MIDQLTVFLENSEGRLAALCSALADADVNMHALVVADTAEFGVVRIVCDDPERARELLTGEGFGVRVVPVAAVELPSRPGSAAELFSALDAAGRSVEYAYCFDRGPGASVAVFKSDGEVESVVSAAGLRVLSADELYVG